MKALVHNWPICGCVACVFILLQLFTNSRAEPWGLEWLFWLHLPIYMLHQTEEYVFPGGFPDYVNAMITHSPEQSAPVLAPLDSFVINVIIVWGGITAAALVGTDFVIFPAIMLGVSLVNSLVHIGNALRLRGYNPGLGASLFLNLPFACFVLWRVVAEGELMWEGVGRALLAAFLLHLGLAGWFVLKLRGRRKA